jgi:hypothetical protein
MDILGKLKDWLSMGAVPLGGTAIASAFVLLSPSSILTPLGLKEVIEVVRPYLGGAFVLSTSLLICLAMKGVWDNLIRRQLRDSLTVRLHRRELHSLTEDEKDYLRRYIEKQTRSCTFALNDGIAMGLQQRKIIIRASNLGIPGGYSFPFQIQPWAWEYLNKHPELVASLRSEEERRRTT